jgi:aminodeoxyfutalosine synthase
MAGARTPQSQPEAGMIKAIREAGRIPVQRDTFYQPIKVWDNAPPAPTPADRAPSRILEENLASA